MFKGLVNFNKKHINKWYFKKLLNDIIKFHFKSFKNYKKG